MNFTEEWTMKTDRPWGSYSVIHDSKSTKVKSITVLPKQRLSYQSHKNRSEHWIIVEGEAEVTLQGVTKTYHSGQYVFIPALAKHRVANLGDLELTFIEVQTGSSFDEEDIVRYDDDYGRAK